MMTMRKKKVKMRKTSSKVRKKLKSQLVQDWQMKSSLMKNNPLKKEKRSRMNKQRLMIDHIETTEAEEDIEETEATIEVEEVIEVIIEETIGVAIEVNTEEDISKTMEEESKEKVVNLVKVAKKRSK